MTKLHVEVKSSSNFILVSFANWAVHLFHSLEVNDFFEIFVTTSFFLFTMLYLFTVRSLPKAVEEKLTDVEKVNKLTG